MKTLYTFLLLLAAYTAAAQTPCPYYKELIQNGDAAATKNDYETAMNQYNAAMLHCPAKADEAQARVLAVFKRIEDLKNRADSLAGVAEYQLIQANMQKRRAEEALHKTDSALAQVQIQEAKNKKIIDASYFYADRFALATKRDNDGNLKYGFIDKNADIRIEYRYDFAQPFEEQTGLAKVGIKQNPEDEKSPTLDFLIDTLGTEYRVAYQIKDLHSDIVALDLRNQQLDSLPEILFTHTQLKILLLNYNQLKTLPKGFLQLPHLQVLNLWGNQISKLENLDNLKALQIFDISWNKITKIENLNNLKALQTFSIDHNQIAKLENLDNLAALQYFDVCSNEITQLENLDKLSQLQTFLIWGNEITKLENLDKLKMLKILDISDNALTKLESLDNLRYLQILEISDNQITKLENLVYLENLTVFNISDNKITKLENLDNLISLHTFNISYNRLTKLEGLTHLNALEILDISENSILKLEGLDNLRALQVFLLSHNRISKLEGLDNLNVLRTLDITENKLTKLEGLDKLKTLQILQISDNEITKLAGLNNLRVLQYLDISRNKLTKLEGLENLKALQSLYIYTNQLTTLAELAPLKALEVLNITDNQITKLADLSHLPALQKMKIDRNPITEISPSFWKLPISIDYVNWIESCATNKDTALALIIRKGIQNKNFDLNYGNLSYYLVFCHDFEGAIWAGEKYVQKGGKSIGILSNLAMGYLYHGDYEKAYTIYAKYKNEKDDSEHLGKEIFLKDLEDVAAANVLPKNPEDVKKIKAFLQVE